MHDYYKVYLQEVSSSTMLQIQIRVLLPLHYRLVLYYSIHTKLYAAGAASLPVRFDGPDGTGEPVFSWSCAVG